MAESGRTIQILAFLETVDALKSVERSGYLADASRHENSAEHSWHACVYALLLHRESRVDVRLERVLELLLVHDLVEVYAGDTNAYDTAALVGKREREAAAADRLFGTLPDDLGPWLRGLWEEFESEATPEARFAHAMDRLQGFGQNLASGGRAWRERGVTQAMTRRRIGDAYHLDPAITAMVDHVWHRADRDRLFGDPVIEP